MGPSYKQIAQFAKRVEKQHLVLPDGCFINYDLELIDFMKSLDSDGVAKDYEALKAALNRRPTFAEFYRAGVNITRVRQQYGSWLEFVSEMGDLGTSEREVMKAHGAFLREIETTAMTKSFKMVLIEALQELDGWITAPALEKIAQHSWQVLQRRRTLLMDLPDAMREVTHGAPSNWQSYWRSNPVHAWIGEGSLTPGEHYFKLEGSYFKPNFHVSKEGIEVFESLLQELVDYRLAAYEARRDSGSKTGKVIPLLRAAPSRPELPYFRDLKIACGHFRSSSSEVAEHRALGDGYGQIDPARHFIARATGNSMNGGKQPIADGDYLLLELVSPSNAGSVTGSIMAIERQDESGDNQYLLRVVYKAKDGSYILRANNPDYEDMVATDAMRTLARLKAVIDPIDMAIGQHFLREEVPALFHEEFNPGNWNSGHVVLNERKVHILFVTLNKQGKAEDHRYLDHWVDEHTFHWQTQNATTPESKRGQEIIEHEKLGITIHLFVRDSKLLAGKSAPFFYVGKVCYKSHTGSAPMSVMFSI